MDKIIYHFFSPESWFMITSRSKSLHGARKMLIAYRHAQSSYLQQDRKLCKIPLCLSLAFCPFPWDCEATMGTSLQRKRSRKIDVFLFVSVYLWSWSFDLLYPKSGSLTPNLNLYKATWKSYFWRENSNYFIVQAFKSEQSEL